jgi:hypothetical protein
MTDDETMQRLRESVRQTIDDEVLTHTGRSIGDIASGKVADAVLQALAAEIERAEVGARIYQEQQKITMNLDITTSADYKRGFQDALDQLDTISNKRIAELQSKTGGDKQPGHETL